MKLASIREFRSGVSGYTRKGQMVIVTRSGKMIGCFLPLTATEDIPIELKREFVTTLGGYLATQLAAKKIQEKTQTQYILYGGSVTPENVNRFTSMQNINGVLVGTDSLDSKKFIEIIKNA